MVGATDGHGTPLAPTPELQLRRTFKLKGAYADLKTELHEEMAMIESRILTPTTDARACIAPIRKTIKKRENKRVDFEQAQDRASKLQRKMGRSPKEDKSLAKAEDDMARAEEVWRPYPTRLLLSIYKPARTGIRCRRFSSEGNSASPRGCHVQDNTSTPIIHGSDSKQAFGVVLYVDTCLLPRI